VLVVKDSGLLYGTDFSEQGQLYVLSKFPVPVFGDLQGALPGFPVELADAKTGIKVK
jgi:hypothetical protein